MKIYFAASIRGGREDVELYREILRLLSGHGTVLQEHVGDPGITSSGESLGNEAIYERDMRWLNDADVVVAEVSTPSLGVGYEIAKAEGSKPILCLFRKSVGRNLSAMLAGNKNLMVKEYESTHDLSSMIKDFFDDLQGQQNGSFLSPVPRPASVSFSVDKGVVLIYGNFYNKRQIHRY